LRLVLPARVLDVRQFLAFLEVCQVSISGA